MLQQFLAFIIIFYFLFRLFWQKKKNEISRNEFIFWLIFWAVSMLLILFIKKIDQLVANFGFTASGIDVLLYASVIIIFYLIFRLRLRMEKIERNLTKIIREITLNKM